MAHYSINNIKERFHPEKVMNQIQPGEPMLSTKDTISALNSIQSYTNCYPYMDAAHLISKLYELWELQSRKNHAGRQQLTRKIMSMRMDPKADQDLLQMSEILKEEYADCLALSNIGFYRIRVLNDLYNSK